MPEQEFDVSLDFRRAFGRLESVINQGAQRVIDAQGQSEARIRNDVQQGVSWLGNEIRTGYGPRAPLIYPPAAGIAATPRGAHLMADHGGAGHGGNSGGAFWPTLGLIAAAGLIGWFVVCVLPCPNCGKPYHTVNTLVEAPLNEKEGTKSCPIWVLKGTNADGVPEYKADFNC